MRLVDASVLLYAVDETAEHHAAAKRWLDAALSSGESVGLPWVSVLAFVRLSTHPSIYPNPLTIDQALDVVEAWTARPNVIAPEPDRRHARRMRELLDAVGRAGNLVDDAHLAALALQHGAEIGTFDRDFGRFPGVRWVLPA